MNGFEVKVGTVGQQIVAETNYIENDIRTNMIRQAVDTADIHIRGALIELGWQPPTKSSTKCIVKGCNNYHGQGRFIGELCSPCHQMLSSGNGAYNSTFVGDLYQKANQLEVFKTQLRELTKETK